jgi:hypothetical protein
MDSDSDDYRSPKMVKDQISAVKDSKTVTINTHSRNSHYIIVYSSEGKKIYEHDGYAPYFINCAVTGKEDKDDYDEDDIHFKIDVETGKILNWNADLFKKHLEKQIKKQIKEESVKDVNEDA